MKQKRLVSMIGALVVIISAVALITGCPQANGNNGKKENTTINNGGNSGGSTGGNNGANSGNNTGNGANTGGNTSGNTGGGNSGSSLEVQSTAEVDPALKGTVWRSSADVSIEFAENGNIANISRDQALYTVEGEKINFDLSSQISNFQNMTEEKLIRESKVNMRKEIADLEKEIKEAQEKGDEQKKQELKERLERAKKWLNALENPDAKVKEEMKQSVKVMHEYAGKMKPYAKFDGIFNSEKTQLTIEKFPYYDWRDKEVIVKKIVFEKE